MGNITSQGAKSGFSLGINGLGRIGKLTLWHHIARKYFDEIVINTGRIVGTSIIDVAHYIERDSTYGPLHAYLYGHKAERVITELDDKSGVMRIDGIPVKILREARDPRHIDWDNHRARLVIDTTGKFLDPTRPADHPDGSVRGHLEGGAKKVIVSAPFKIKDKSEPMPEDAVTTVMGINENDYDPRTHKIISGASCTTTCLAHIVKPIIDYFGPKKILTASMATVHAVTGSQEVLDRPAKAGATDLRKNRSIFNNIILTTTGAANTLGLVIPEIGRFFGTSIRMYFDDQPRLFAQVAVDPEAGTLVWPNGVDSRTSMYASVRRKACCSVGEAELRGSWVPKPELGNQERTCCRAWCGFTPSTSAPGLRP